MKILMVSHEYPPVGGGGANACMFLAKEYASRGHSVTVVTVWFEELAEHETTDGVEICRVKAKRTHKEHCSFQEMASYVTKAIPLACRLQEENRYDICQVFFGIPSGPIGYWLKRRYGLPYVIRFGGGDIPGFQERFGLLYKVIGPAVKVLWRSADALVANSRGLQNFALKFYSRMPVGIIHNGVDTAFFYPDYAKRDKNRLNLLFVSRLVERKGLQFIVPQLKKIQMLAGKPICLTVVGDGPYRPALEALTVQNGVADMVQFEGQKGKNELLPYYQAGDVFIFPSMREGMPNAVLEAMACGLPIVMAPCEGSDELIDGNGFVTEAEGFPEKVAECIRRQQELSYGSRRLAEDRFSWTKAAESYIALMEGMCGPPQLNAPLTEGVHT